MPRKRKPIDPLDSIQKRTLWIQWIVGIIAVSAIVAGGFLALSGKSVETKLGTGGFVSTVLGSCIVATFRLWNCLNSINITQFYMQVNARKKAEETLKASPCLKGTGTKLLDVFTQRSEGNDNEQRRQQNKQRGEENDSEQRRQQNKQNGTTTKPSDDES